MKRTPFIAVLIGLAAMCILATDASAYYDPGTGRFLSRDPSPGGITGAMQVGTGGGFLPRDSMGQYHDGMNLYQYVSSQPTAKTDPTGLWGKSVHHDATILWAERLKYPNKAAKVIGEADEAVDGFFGTPVGPRGPLPGVGNQSYHFDRPWGGPDSRLEHFNDHFTLAVHECVKNDDGEAAAVRLGTALHPLQDWVAHGDYGKFDDGNIFATHNMYSPQRDFGDPEGYPDNPGLDADNSPDGRPAGSAMYWISPNIGVVTGKVRGYAWYVIGTKRYRLTKGLTEDKLSGFMHIAKNHGGPCCKVYFGIKP